MLEVPLVVAERRSSLVCLLRSERDDVCCKFTEIGFRVFWVGMKVLTCVTMLTCYGSILHLSRP